MAQAPRVPLLQAIVTAPPQLQRERWIKGRMLFLDAAPHKMPGKDPFRIRLGPEASTRLWRLVFSEPSLDALQSLDVLADAVKSELEEMNAAKATGMEVDRS